MSVPERAVVAVRTEGPHEHVTAVKLANGEIQEAATVIAAIDAHEAHYAMRQPDVLLGLPYLLRVAQCPDCLERVLWA